MVQPASPDSFNFVLIDIARLIRSAFEKKVTAAELGITAGEARVLIHAARRGPVRQNILAESLGMTPMSVTGFVCRLESAGLVERETDPEDRRANIIRLTQKADSVLAAIFGIGSEITAIAGGDMSEGELEALRVELCGVRDRLETARHSINCSKENRDG